jgi:NAD(P)-dependent dehydrogenase (short-subunit alcohol dehydrogenase family)
VIDRLSGKTAIITGATGGIGAATARLFLAEGANLVVVGRSADKLDALTASLGSQERVAHCVADAQDESGAQAAADAAIDRFGGVDILFANAGTEGVAKPLDELTLDEFDAVYRTNVLGVWMSMKYCVAPMKARGGGSIIATTSIAGLVGFPGLSAYVASKHAVCGLVRTAAQELGPNNIRVNGIAPGPVDNRMIESLEEQLSPADPGAVRNQMIESVALRRYATNEEVAKLTLFLASDESAYCSGGIHTIDGGYTAA